MQNLRTKIPKNQRKTTKKSMKNQNFDPKIPKFNVKKPKILIIYQISNRGILF